MRLSYLTSLFTGIAISQPDNVLGSIAQPNVTARVPHAMAANDYAVRYTATLNPRLNARADEFECELIAVVGQEHVSKTSTPGGVDSHRWEVFITELHQEHKLHHFIAPGKLELTLSEDTVSRYVSPEAHYNSVLDRRDESKKYVAVAKTPGLVNDTTISNTRKFIESQLPKDSIIIEIKSGVFEPEEDQLLLGWKYLELSDEALQKVREHPDIKTVYWDYPAKRQRAIAKPQVSTHGQARRLVASALLDRAIKAKRALTWYKQQLPSWNLRMTSLPPQQGIDNAPDYVYESHRADGVFIYVVDAGVQSAVLNDQGSEEFRWRENGLLSMTARALRVDSNVDDTPESHGTMVSSIALGKLYGVAKHATLVPVKVIDALFSDIPEGFREAARHIKEHDRESRSVVVCASGDTRPSDPSDSQQTDMGALVSVIGARALFDLGVPLILAAGNDRNPDTGERQDVDYWPPNLEAENFPMIVVGAADEKGIRYPHSQGGSHLTTYAPGWEGVQGVLKDGTRGYGTGTSYATPHVAGVIATWLGHDTRPWSNDDQSSIERVKSIRDFIRSSDSAAWQRPGGERVLWNSATVQDHDSAQPDPELPLSNLDCYTATQSPKIGGKKSEYTNKINTFCDTVDQRTTSDTNTIMETYFQGADNEAKFAVSWTPGINFEPVHADCMASLTNVLEWCDRGADATAGGEADSGGVRYRIEALKDKPQDDQPPPPPPPPQDPTECIGLTKNGKRRECV